jgi:hypothetical protein
MILNLADRERNSGLGLLRQEALLVRQLARQVFLDHEVESPFRQGLLLGALAHFEHLIDGLDPRLVRLEEGVVFERILCSLDVHRLQRVGRILEFEVDDVLGSHTQKLSLGHAKEAIDVRGVAGTNLERAVDVGDSVRITVDKAVDGDLFGVSQQSYEAPRCARGHTTHFDQDAVGALPKLVVVQALKHTASFDHDDELGFGFKLEVFNRVGD